VSKIVSMESADFAPPPTKMILGDTAKVKLVKTKWGALILSKQQLTAEERDTKALAKL